ncbi:hypothetical protein CQ017_11150 [Arthrobacter sp. MYb224]|uniref:hypothetical protein n=1 Tax=Arthrobacter sp. MYb224 TaxID=1848600 RepID=UPI000CFC82BB|nr:hypothetical protein [Arthrobacter sp. MYb224]PQZ98168.1 hypothetical protein CQ017_11150 [Arthrobacter sp. MYb224]
MSNVLPFLVLIGFGLALTLLIRRGVLSQRRADLVNLAHRGAAAEAGIAGKVLRAVRARNMAALIVALLAGTWAIYLNQAFPKANGLQLVAAPAGIWILVAIVFIIFPIPHDFASAEEGNGARVSADLTPRSTGMFGPAWGIIVPGVMLGATLIGLLVAGLASSTDERGRYRMLPYASANGASLDENMMVTEVSLGDGATGPFPGWYYGIPLLVFLVLGALLTLWALNRNARRPSLRSPALQGFDNAVRTHNAYVLSTGFSAMLCFQLLPLLAMAASAIYNAGYTLNFVVGETYTRGALPEGSTDLWNAALALSLAGLGLLVLVVGAILLGQLAGWIATIFKATDKEIGEGVSA